MDENGDYRGIATSDLAIALADEAENQKHPYGYRSPGLLYTEGCKGMKLE